MGQLSFEYINMLQVGILHYLILSAVLFTIGICGIFLNRGNIITILMSIELILLAVNINMISFSVELGDLTGQIFSIFILTVAAAEAAIGLAILITFFRKYDSINPDNANRLKG